MQRLRLLKFRLIAPTNFNGKRISVKCPIYDDWKLFIWNDELENDMHDQVVFILCNRFGFRLDEITAYAEEENEHYFVMITNFERRIIKEKNH